VMRLQRGADVGGALAETDVVRLAFAGPLIIVRGARWELPT